MKAFLLLAALSSAQPSASELQHQLDRLVATTRVLYVAAHPDDENTQLLAQFVGDRDVHASYLSLTRGAGGQNRIGEEQGRMLGVLRTEELRAARAMDRAGQRFTAARDFGYSKSIEETLQFWGHEATLGDVVEVVRRFRPHVILTRFPERGTSHGHHVASARLAREAFHAAGDPSRFPGQLDRLEPWQPTRLLWDVPHFMQAPEDDRPEVTADIGGYDVLRGASYGEIAARSRSQHRSQGFGDSPEYGPRTATFRLIAGEEPSRDPLEDVGSAWRDVEGGARVRDALQRARNAFRPRQPERAIPALVDAYRALPELGDPWLQRWKGRQIVRTLVGCAGLRLQAHTERGRVVPGERVKVTLQAQSRRPASLRLARVKLGERVLQPGAELAPDRIWTRGTRLEVSGDASVTTPPWFGPRASKGRYDVSDAALRTRPRRPPPHVATFVLRHGGTRLAVRVPVRHARTDPERGQVTTRLLTAPPATLTPNSDVHVVPAGSSRTVRLYAEAAHDGVSGRVRLEVPEGWQVTPAARSVEFTDGRPRKAVRFQVTATEDAQAGEGRPAFEDGTRSWSWSEHGLHYPHLPPRTVLARARMRLVPVSVDVPSGRIGYIPGAGDRVAKHLRQLGLKVTKLPAGKFDRRSLEGLTAVVVGVRAWSTRPQLAAKAGLLMDYVRGGGTLLLQYDKAPRGGTRKLPLGPMKLAIGRDRVTDETAEVRMLTPKHAALESPNPIRTEDFEGWVQERGLYFADSWGNGFTPLLSMSDPGQQPVRGALLVGSHGEGHVVYTGLSLFRQLPAGVPGAYRLVANLLSLGEPDEVGKTTKSGSVPGLSTSWYLAGALVVVLGLLAAGLRFRRQRAG